MLMAHLSPGDLPRKTFLAILADHGASEEDTNIKIKGTEYNAVLMDEDYDEGWQISGTPGEIVLMDFVTYGYGERIQWDKLDAQRAALAAWVDANKERYDLQDTSISVGANYW